MAAAPSLKEYLKKYEATGQAPKKKKRRKAAKPAAVAGAVLIVDEDPVWAKEVIPDAEEEDSAGEETPVIDEDIEVKRLRRLELLRSRKPYHAISEDGSGWVSISDVPKRLGSSAEPPDLTPLRQRRARFDTPSPGHSEPGPSDAWSGDLSPPRQRQRHYDSPSPELEARPSSSCGKGMPDMPPTRRREPGEDFSFPRRGKGFSDDLSPPRRSKKDVLEVLSPPRRGRKRSPEGLSPPRSGAEGSPEDLSRPRRGVKGSPEDLSPLRRGGKGSPKDLSPPRRGRKGWLEDLSPPRRRRGSLEDLSPPRRGRKGSPEDLSLPRRGGKGSAEDQSPPRREMKSLPEGLSPRRQSRHHLLEANKPPESAEQDLSPPRRSKRGSVEFSPPRRSHNLPDADPSPSRESRKKHLSAKEEQRAGLFTRWEIKEEIERKKKEETSRFAAMDPALSGKGAEPIYRDKEGKRISKEELLKMRKGEEKEKPKEKKLEWGKGLAQKREAEARASELELEKEKPFARSRDDPELDKMLRERPRWGDPMAHLIKKKHSEPVLEDFGVDEKIKESGFIIPQTIPSHSWIKRGIDPPPNRYGIRPGRHWDGVDRSSGYEKEMFKRQNEKRATETDAYLWSVSDM